jgi:hypothetical protein
LIQFPIVPVTLPGVLIPYHGYFSLVLYMRYKKMPKLFKRIVITLLMSLMIIFPIFSIACGYQDVPKSGDTISQANDLLQFTAGGHVLGFGNNAVYLAGLDHALTVKFAGGNTVQPVADSASEDTNGTAEMGRVCYNNVWNNIDIIYNPVPGDIAESTYVVYPGGSPADISLHYNVPVDIKVDGSLCCTFDTGYMTESAPFAWQEVNGEQLLVDVSFQRQANDRIGFNMAGYNADYAVYIDPTYQWHTFFGSESADSGEAIAIDSSGNIYVTGMSLDGWNGPGVTPPLHAHDAGINSDIVVVKLSSAGAYQWHTFYGGSDNDYGSNIALDQSLNIYIAGYSYTSWLGSGSEAPKHSYTGNSDIVILKLDNAGAYQWHTFYGSGDSDMAEGIALDQSAGACVVGYSDDNWNGPAGEIPVNRHSTGINDDIVAVKVDTNGGYLWHTFHGSTDHESGSCVALDQSNNVYIAGYSNDTWDGPTGQSPLHDYTDDCDIVILKLSNTGAYQWHTFYGCTMSDTGYDIALDRSANVYVSGYSDGTWNGPNGESPLNAYTDLRDIFALSLNSNGAYRWHTFYGCSTSYDESIGIALDQSANVYVAGYSEDTWNGPGDIPPVNNHSDGSNGDMVLIRLNGNGDYVRHTFYGSTDNDGATGVKVDTTENVYLSGYSFNTWNGPENTFPLHAYSGGVDIVVVKTGLEAVAVEEAEPEAEAPGLPDPKPFLDDSGAIVLGNPANIGIGNVNVLQPQVAMNRQAVIYANVVNKGDIVGSFTITLKINGQVEETRAVSVNGNSAVPVQFNVTRDEPGTYNVDINGRQTSFTVVGSASSSTDSTRTVFIIVLIVCSLAVVAALMMLIMRRRTSN